MAGFTSFTDYRTQVVEGGQMHRSSFRKTTTVATTAGVFFDGSMMSGHPVTNFYASSPLVAATLQAREGLQHGSNQAPNKKFLKSVTAFCGVAPINLMFTDSLLYYPFIDGDETAEQVLDNAVTLPRYTDGANVRAYLVAQGVYTGGAQFFFTYTNQNGVAGRISGICTSNTSATAGTVVNTGTTAGLFGWSIPLAQGDTGIRSVQSFQWLTPNGGIFALVLAAELGFHAIREANTPTEKDFFIETGFNPPQIFDGAFLNYLVLPNASIAATPIIGTINTVWG
jgi:hypothetical protein